MKIVNGKRARQAMPSVHQIHMGRDKRVTIDSLSTDHTINSREEVECVMCASSIVH